jgi:2-polyprenyl-6-methoxyphenol hydroxylase-like FAD-dependent oxidoreductase
MPSKSSPAETSVLITGAGPTGLTLAIELARRCIPVRLIDAAATPFTGSRGKGLQPRTLEVFDDLGIIAPILAAGAPYPRLRIHAGPFSLRIGSLGSSKPATEETPYPNLWMVPQGKTEEILRQRLEDLGRKPEFGIGLFAFTQDFAAIHAELSNGESLRARYLIGCDGAHSAVRKALGLQLLGESIAEKTSVVADLIVEGLDRRDWHVWPLAKGGSIGLCPLPHTELFQFTAPGTAEIDIASAVHRATGHRVSRVVTSSAYKPQVRMVDRYRSGRVFLAGDAAHVHPPAGGQGLNTGVQDAYNLGWKLACVLGGQSETLLDTYQAERLPVAAAVLGLSKRLHQKPTTKRGDSTNQLSLNYRLSPLSSGNPCGKLHAGDRMPDAHLTDGTRLFERMRGPHATEAVTPEGTYILIRPDGYIATIGSTRTEKYLGQPVVTVRLAPKSTAPLGQKAAIPAQPRS